MNYMIAVVIILNTWIARKIYKIEVRLKVLELFVEQILNIKSKEEV